MIIVADSMLNDDEDDGLFAGIDPNPSSYDGQTAAQPMEEPIQLGMDEFQADASEAFNDVQARLAYYQRLFPFRLFFEWLNHGNSIKRDFTNREIAFTLQNDAYLRYLSFLNVENFKTELLRLNPSRFEIGPVYSAPPRDRKAIRKAAFKPVEKELVLDIDLTDYDDIRTCCTKTTICEKCWQYITVAIKILDRALREDFGFVHILWVYSGRRGAHAWVCDRRVRLLDDSSRRAIAGYLEVVRGSSQLGKRLDLKRPLYPGIAESLKIAKDYFTSLTLQTQDPWRDRQGWERILRLLPDKNLTAALEKKWSIDTTRSSKRKWADIDAMAESGVSNTLDTKALVAAKQDIILEYMYPRLDAEVTKHLNHLLKSPFCIHPGTDAETPEKFNPTQVPTVIQLLSEIDACTVNSDGTRVMPDYTRTSLKPYIEQFKRFVSTFLKDERHNTRKKDEVNISVDKLKF